MLPSFEQYDKCPVCTAPRFAKMNAERVCKFFYKFHKGIVVDGQCIKTNALDKEGVSYGIDIKHLHVTCNRCNYEWIEQTALQERDFDERSKYE